MRAARERWLAFVALALPLAGTAGCGTVTSRLESNDLDSTLYGGTRFDARFIGSYRSASRSCAGWIYFALAPALLVDLPFSLAADTLLLPLTLPEHLSGRRQDCRAFVSAFEARDLVEAKAIAEKRPAVLRLEAHGGRTPLHMAVAEGRVEFVEWLARETAPDDSTDSNGDTPLTLAAQAGRTDLARILLHRGADPGATARGATPLHYAALLGHREVAELLLERGADVDARDEREATPLHFAVQRNELDVARLLVRHGADVNARTQPWKRGALFNAEEGRTPLGEALHREHAAMAAFLRSQGSHE